LVFVMLGYLSRRLFSIQFRIISSTRYLTAAANPAPKEPIPPPKESKEPEEFAKIDLKQLARRYSESVEQFIKAEADSPPITQEQTKIQESTNRQPIVFPGYAGRLASDLFNEAKQSNRINELRDECRRLSELISKDYEIRFHVATTEPKQLPVSPPLQNLIAELQRTRKTKHLENVLALYESTAENYSNEILLKFKFSKHPLYDFSILFNPNDPNYHEASKNEDFAKLQRRFKIDSPDFKKLAQASNFHLKKQCDDIAKIVLPPSDRQLTYNIRIEPSIMGGFILQVGQTILDLSHETQVDALFQELIAKQEEYTMGKLNELNNHLADQLSRLRPPNLADVENEPLPADWNQP